MMADEAVAAATLRQGRGGIFDGAAGLDPDQDPKGLTPGSERPLQQLASMTGGNSRDAQFEEMVAGLVLDMDKIKQSTLDDFVAKVKKQLSERQERDEEAKQCSDHDDDSDTEQSNLKISPNSSQPRRPPYQATVEDDTEDCAPESTTSADTPAKDARPELHLDVPPAAATASPRSSPSFSVVSTVSSTGSYAVGSPGSAEGGGAASPRQRHRVHFSHRSPPVVVNGVSGGGRAGSDSQSPRQGVARMAAVPEAGPGPEPVLSAVDVKWGTLFTEAGEPTTRLQQVLRGLANYLILESNPKNSLVLPPEKLLKFYDKYRVRPECVDYSRIFDHSSTRSLNALSRLYEALECEFHLIQDKPGATPDVPALTPHGLARWLTIFAQAHPDDEAERLAAVVADLPLQADGLAIDGGPDRVPRQLSRHLLPAQPVDRAYLRLANAVIAWKRAVGAPDATPAPPSSSWAPRERRASDNGAGGRVFDHDFDIEVARRRGGSGGGRSYRDGKDRDRRPPTRDEVSRRYSLSRHPSSRQYSQQQAEALAPPSISRRGSQRSPPSGSRHRREVPRAMSDSAGTCSPGTGPLTRAALESSELQYQQQLQLQQRRTREDEYRLAQGRDHHHHPHRWGSLESTPRGAGGAAGVGGGGPGVSERRRSLLMAAAQADGNPTYEEYLADKGGGY